MVLAARCRDVRSACPVVESGFDPVRNGHGANVATLADQIDHCPVTLGVSGFHPTPIPRVPISENRSQRGKVWGRGHLAECCLVRSEDVLREGRSGAHRAARLAALCRIPDYAESSMKHLHLALSWRTETIKPIRHSGRES